MISANTWIKAFSTMLSAMAVIALCFVIFLPVANAEEKPCNLISCRSGTVTILSGTKELTVYSLELKGIDRASNGDKTFENFTHRCMAIIRIKGGEIWQTGYCKYMDPDGDFFIVETVGPVSAKGGDWKFIQGTGKWKGIKGGGTYRRITKGKPIVKGTFQNCIKITGTYELP